MANAEAPLRSSKRIIDQQQTTKRPSAKEDTSTEDPKAPKSDKAGQSASEKRAKDRGVSRYNVKKKQAAAGRYQGSAIED